MQPLKQLLDVSGATGIDGDFDVNMNKFTVESSTGNTTVAGTLEVTGASTLTGALTANGGTTTTDLTATGTSTLSTVDINGGAIDGTAIGK